MGDILTVARDGGPTVVGIFELCDWLGRKGLSNLAPMNKGGSQEIAGLRVTMTDARHSGGFVDNGQMVYMGEPAGYVVRLADGRAISFAGDTSLFGDMRLIGEIYKPEIAFLPIGDRFTMDPAAAARACEFSASGQVVRALGDLPMLTGRPADSEHLSNRGACSVLE